MDISVVIVEILRVRDVTSSVVSLTEKLYSARTKKTLFLLNTHFGFSMKWM